MFIKRLCSLLRCSVRNPAQNADVIAPRSLKTDKEYFVTSTEVNAECNVLPLSSPQIQLQVVIRQLELQNK